MNIDKIKDLMKQKDMSMYKLSKITGISDTQLRRLFTRENKYPRVDTAKKIAKALDVDINEII